VDELNRETLEQDELSEEELDAEDLAELPAREAMSLVNPAPVGGIQPGIVDDPIYEISPIERPGGLPY